MSDRHPLWRLVSGLTVLSGLFLIGLSAALLANLFATFPRVMRTGRIGISYEWKAAEKYIVITRVMAGYPAHGAGLREGDRIVAVNDRRMADRDYGSREVWGEDLAGSRVALTVRRDGREFQVELLRQSYAQSGALWLTIVVGPVVVPLIALIYGGVGLWIIKRGRGARATFLIGLFCICYASLCLVATPASWPSGFLDFNSPGLLPVRQFLAYLCFLTPSIWLYTFLIFPRPSELYRRRPFRLTAAAFAPALLLMILWRLIEDNGKWFAGLVGAVFFTSFAVGTRLVLRGAERVEQPLLRRQYRLLAAGLKYGAVFQGCGWLAALAGGFLGDPEWLWWLLAFAGQIGGLLMPFAFLNSFLEHKLIQTEAALRRKLTSTLFTTALLLTYGGVVFWLGRLAVAALGIRADSSAAIVLVFVASTGFMPIHRWLRDVLSRRLHRERASRRDSLRAFVQTFSTFADPQELTRAFCDWVRSALNIPIVVAATLDPGAAALRLPGFGQPLPFHPGNPRSILTEAEKGRIFFWDELDEEKKGRGDREEVAWAEQNGISMTVPLQAHGSLVGVLNVGSKASGGDFTGDDLEVLNDAAGQVGLAIKSLRLQIENLEKRRLDKEMEMALKIQRNLMPLEIPAVTGLDVHGESRPCHEVAGDYFDIIPVDDRRTALVVADVSGKGAGAGMLMANLQASLRLGLDLMQSLPEIIYRINNLICKNTPPETFITCFLGIWDHTTRRVEYINAGHNPPLLLHADGRLEKLHATGLPLGVFPDERNETASVELRAGAVLAIYTDGCVETSDAGGDMFDEERMIEVLREFAREGAGEISRALIERIDRFRGGVPLMDDLTLLVAKAVTPE